MELLSEKSLCLRLASFAPAVDLVATVSSLDGALAVWRPLSWQRLWSAPPGGDELTALCWRPDGGALAAGDAAGGVALYDVESGAPLLRRRPHSLAVTSLSWSAAAEAGGGGPAAAAAAAWTARRPDGLRSAAGRDPLLGRRGGPLTLLLSGDAGGGVELAAFGALPLGRIAATSASAQQPPAGAVLHTAAASDFSSVAVVCAGGAASVAVALWPTPLLGRRRADLGQLSRALHSASALRRAASACLDGCARPWAEAVGAGRAAALSPLGPDWRSELASFALTGVASDAVASLLLGGGAAGDGALRRAARGVDVAAAGVVAACGGPCAALVDDLSATLSDLRALCLWPPVADELGVGAAPPAQPPQASRAPPGAPPANGGGEGGDDGGCDGDGDGDGDAPGDCSPDAMLRDAEGAMLELQCACARSAAACAEFRALLSWLLRSRARAEEDARGDGGGGGGGGGGRAAAAAAAAAEPRWPGGALAVVAALAAPGGLGGRVAGLDGAARCLARLGRRLAAFAAALPAAVAADAADAARRQQQQQQAAAAAVAGPPAACAAAAFDAPGRWAIHDPAALCGGGGGFGGGGGGAVAAVVDGAVALTTAGAGGNRLLLRLPAAAPAPARDAAFLGPRRLLVLTRAGLTVVALGGDGGDGGDDEGEGETLPLPAAVAAPPAARLAVSPARGLALVIGPESVALVDVGSG